MLRSRIHECTISLRFLGIILTLQTSFKPLLLGGGGGGLNPLVEVTVNSKEENSEDFCFNYVQEFGLWELALSWRVGVLPSLAGEEWPGRYDLYCDRLSVLCTICLGRGCSAAS
jgi:hypothetical protein